MHLPRILAVLSPLAALSVFAAGPAGSQAEKRLAAREIFYSAQSEPAPATKAAPPQAAVTKKKAAVESAKTKPAPPPTGSAAGPSPGPAIARHRFLWRPRINRK